LLFVFFFFFFFSSRRRHTRFDCDWSSDVCSSDLLHALFCSSGGNASRSPSPRPVFLSSGETPRVFHHRTHAAPTAPLGSDPAQSRRRSPWSCSRGAPSIPATSGAACLPQPSACHT